MMLKKALALLMLLTISGCASAAQTYTNAIEPRESLSVLEKWKKAVVHLEGATDSEGTYSRFKRIDGLLKQLQSGKIDHQKFVEEISGPSRDIRVQGTSLFLMHKGKRYLVTARHVVFDEVSAKREI